MLYNNIVVDVFNLFYRVKNDSIESNSLAYARKCIGVINNEIKSHLKNGGKLYLLYDPIPKDDLGSSRSFKTLTGRQEDVATYKRNRVHNADILKTVLLIRKYFSHRGDEYINVASTGAYEADDFVEPLIKEGILTGKTALITTDEDWCRYISEDIDMINENLYSTGWDSPFTPMKFMEKYGFNPTIASVCFWKACFGDNSDNITGALMIKSRSNELKNKAFELIKIIGDYNMTLEELKNQLFGRSYQQIVNSKDRTEVEKFMMLIFSLDSKYSVASNLDLNLRVIECRCKEVAKFLKSKPVDEKYNSIIEQVLGFKVEGQKKKVKFGNIRVK